MNISRTVSSLQKLCHRQFPSYIRCLPVTSFQFNSNLLHTTPIHFEDSKDAIEPVSYVKGKKGIVSVKKVVEGELTSDAVDIDALIQEEELKAESGEFKRFPDDETPDLLFNGIKFKDLPYVNIRMHKNNTKLIARHADERYIYQNTPSMLGFTSAKKRTAVGGQVAGLNMGQKLRGYGIKHVRVRLNGFNAARVSTIQGIIQAGVQVVAIQDATTVHWDWPQRGKSRPQK